MKKRDGLPIAGANVGGSGQAILEASYTLAEEVPALTFIPHHEIDRALAATLFVQR